MRIQACRLLLLTITSFLVLLSCKPPSSSNTEPTAPAASVEAKEPLAIVEEVANDCKLTLGFDAWEPYQYADVGGRVAGLDVELVAAIAEGMGCEIQYQQGTWVSLLSELKAGKVDMLLGASKTEAREEFALFSDAYRMEEFSLYVRKDDESLSESQSISAFIENGSKVGIVEDYYYGPEVSMLLDGSVTSKSFVPAIMGELNVARLLDSDIDGFLEDSFVGASMLRRKALSNYIVAYDITIQTGDAYVMFSKESFTTEQLERFNSELAKVKASGLYQEIIEKYSH